MKHQFYLILLFSILCTGAFSQNIPSYIPTNGLVGYWPFNGNANDESGNGNQLTNNGGVFISDRNGSVNKAISLSNIGTNLNVNSISPALVSGVQSISYWIKLPTQYNHSTLTLLQNGQAYTNGCHLFIDQNDGAYGLNNYLVGVLIGNYQAATFISNQSELGNWCNLVSVYDGTNLKIYFNGVMKSSLPFSGGILPPNNNLLFANWGNPTLPNNAGRLIDDIAIYNRALTQTEITALYNGSGSTNSIVKRFYADSLGIIKCVNCLVGDTGTVNGIVYEAVDRALLETRKNQGADLTKLCTSLVTDMSGLFENNKNFNQAIGNWDVSHVTTMYHMFYNDSMFNQPIGNWDVSSVTHMGGMFGFANNFNQPIGNWNVGKVTDMSWMFANVWWYSIPMKFNKDISNWNVGAVTNMEGMFENASSFNQPIGSWNVSHVTNMGRMFHGCLSFNQTLGNWDVSSVTNMTQTFARSGFNQPIGNWNVSSVISMSEMFTSCPFNQPIDSWDVKSVTSMDKMFSNSVFNLPIGNWDVSSVIIMSGMFSYSNFNQAIGNWNMSKVKHINQMFFNSNFNQAIGNWDVSHVTDMNGIFVNSPFNQPIGNWDVSRVANMNEMFRMATSFNQDISAWDVSKVTTMNTMFQFAYNFNKPIGNWDVSNVINMDNMFDGATAFNQNIRTWCVTKIKVQPNDFSSNCPMTNANKPIWGTCHAFNIEATSSSNGSISPSGTTAVNSGSSQTYTFTPNSGYWIDSVIVNGVQVLTASSYTFNNVTSNQTIRVTYRSLAAALAAANICSNDTLVSTVNLPAQTNVRATTYYSNIYLFNQNNTSNAYKYNVNDRKYTAIADKPTACIECGVAEANGKVYCFNINGTTQAYDIATNTWQNQTPIPTAAGMNLGIYATTLNNLIYLTGGTFGLTQSSFYQYNPQTNLFTKLQDFSQPRVHTKLITYQNKIYAVGGEYYDGSSSKALAMFEEYNPSINTWTVMPSMPEALSSTGTTIYNNKLYVFGGGVPNGKVSNKVYVFDFTSNAWYLESNTLNEGRSNIEAKTANNMVFLFAGNDSTYHTSNQALRYFCKDQLCTCKWAEYVCNGVSSDVPCPTSSLYRPGTVFCNGYATKVLDVTNPITGKTWMDRNLGASQAAISSTDTLAYGDLYQWGRGADGHQCRNSATTTTLSTTDQLGHNNFIISTNSPYDWRFPQNNYLWQGVNGINNPCPTGYRLPTYNELEEERNSWNENNSIGALSSTLKLQTTGGRSFFDGVLSTGIYGFYWSSTYGGGSVWFMNFYTDNAFMSISSRAYGLSVRCIKN